MTGKTIHTVIIFSQNNDNNSTVIAQVLKAQQLKSNGKELTKEDMFQLKPAYCTRQLNCFQRF